VQDALFVAMYIINNEDFINVNDLSNIYY